MSKGQISTTKQQFITLFNTGLPLLEILKIKNISLEQFKKWMDDPKFAARVEEIQKGYDLAGEIALRRWVARGSLALEIEGFSVMTPHNYDPAKIAALAHTTYARTSHDASGKFTSNHDSTSSSDDDCSPIHPDVDPDEAQRLLDELTAAQPEEPLERR